MKIALIQLNSNEDIPTNISSIKKQLSNINNPKDLDLILLPENALFFRTQRKKLFEGIELSDPLFDDFHNFAKENNLALVWGGVALKEQQGVTNSIVIQTPQERAVVHYRKIHLFDVVLPDGTEIKESEQFKAGDAPSVWQWRGWSFGLSICYDLRFPELYLRYAQQGVDVLLIPAAFTKVTGEAHWHHLLAARAIETQAYVLAAAQDGQHGKLSTYGHSLVVDPWGQVVAEIETASGYLAYELSKSEIEKVRKRIPMAEHRILG